MDPDSIPKFKSGKELEEEYNSIEGILERLNVFGLATRADLMVIAETLHELPQEDRDRILSEVLFVIMRAVGTAMKLVLPYRLDKKDIEKHKTNGTGTIGGCIEQPIIMLDFSKMKRPPKSFEGNSKEYSKSVVAHEMAHFILGHYSLSSDSAMERKADDLTEKWGFKRGYKSYKIFEDTARGQKSK